MPSADASITGHVVDLVAYQDEAIVSRTLLKAPGGNVTAFAFDRGQELSEHTVPHDALVQVLDGTGEFSIAGTVHRIRAGEVLLLPAGHPHAVRAVERFKMILIMLRSGSREGR